MPTATGSHGRDLDGLAARKTQGPDVASIECGDHVRPVCIGEHDERRIRDADRHIGVAPDDVECGAHSLRPEVSQLPCSAGQLIEDELLRAGDRAA